jgi:hypothetical protein
MTVDHTFGADCDKITLHPIRQTGRAVAPVFVLVGLVIAATTAIAARAAIVSIVPATAAIYAGVGLPVNLRGLSIAGVHVTAMHRTEGPGELLITGELENLRAAKTPVPNLRLALRDENGRELYVWTIRAPKPTLYARERAPFRSRLAAPPGGVRDVLVNFGEPGDKGLFTESPS